jgi:heterodisulfide reductase subunit A-like polyferredoxin
MINPSSVALVIGAGIGSLRSSLGLAATGLALYLPDKNLASDGTMTQSEKILSTNDYAMCIPSPKPMKCEMRRVRCSLS